jgi:hypothetical protein
MLDASLKPRISGSDKRQRAHVVGVRLLPAEHARLQAKAAEAGLRVGSFLRACALGDAGPRARRSPTVNASLLASAMARLNQAGNNLNQIAHALNAARTVDARETAKALSELRAVLAQIKAAIGRTERE